MPLVTDLHQVEDVYAEARERGLCLANLCTANPYTTQAILQATWEFGREHGLEGLPVVVSATGHYAPEPQLVNYTPLHDARLGARNLIADVETLLSEGSPYSGLRVMLHLDHGKPDLDRELLEEILPRFATVMYDASAWPFDENIQRTAGFVERYGRRIQIEGAVTEIVEATSQAQRDALTTPAEAERFWRETGVSLLVPNLGTEHRATATVARYSPEAARAISARVGCRLVLHGVSSVPDSALATLPADGIVKVNLWTAIERIGGQAVARHVVRDLGRILTREELSALRDGGWLGERYFGAEYRQALGGELGPGLPTVREAARRAAWTEAVVGRLKDFLGLLHYARWGA